MKTIDFNLQNEEYIELNALLKVLGLVNSGGEAKIRISNGEVSYNGEIETRRRKKLRKNDSVIFDNTRICIF